MRENTRDRSKSNIPRMDDQQKKFQCLGWRPEGRADNGGNPSRAHWEAGDKRPSVSFWREDGRPPTGFLKGCALQMGKVLHFLLWSSSEPVVWVRKRPGVAQCSAGHQSGTPSCSRPPDPNQCASRVRADRETGRGYISYLMGQNKAVIFWLDEKVLICFTS